MKKPLAKAKKKTVKAPSAPSTISKPKKKVVKPLAIKAKAVPTKAAQVTHPNLKPEVLAAIDKASKKEAKKSAKAAPKLKQTAEQAAQIHANYMAYLQKNSRPRWGSTEMTADLKGHDGADDLRLLPHITKALKAKSEKDVMKKALDGDSRTLDLIAQCTAYNAWLWANYAARLQGEAMKQDPPVKTVMALNLTMLIPGVWYNGMLGHLLPLLLKNTDVVNAFKALGTSRYKVRLLPVIESPADIPTIYKLYDALGLPRTAHSIWGLCVAGEVMKWTDLPRDVMIVSTSNMRVLNKASEYGMRVIISWKALKGDLKLVREVKESEPYRTLLKSWGGLTPLISLPISSKMETVAKVSKLGDILVI